MPTTKNDPRTDHNSTSEKRTHTLAQEAPHLALENATPQKVASQIDSFEQLALAKPILQAIQDVGYESPSPIQAAAIPHLLNGNDILGQAQTGTGKTAAFALPLLSKIDVRDLKPQILVLAPTRELAIQVAEAFQTYARHLKGFHVAPIYGGQSMTTQLRQLKRGVHVVIGTPGRIMDHLRRGSLALDSLKSLVLDEADEMLKMGFIEDVEWILEHTPKQRQIALFSATMPEVIRKVAQRHLRDPQEVRITPSSADVASIDQYYWQVSGTHKLDALTRILETEDFDAVIVFVRTKTETVELAEKLEARGFATAAINGDMQQAQRERTIGQLKDQKLDIVVATDVAARGLDVKRITHVINYDIPYDTEAYIHRIGRTGRAGRKGKAILFVAPRETRMLRSIEKATKQTIERIQLPSGESVTQRRVDQFKEQVAEVLEVRDLSFFTDIVRNLEQEQGVAALDIAAALAYLNQRERPLQVKEVKPQKDKAHRAESRGDAKRDDSRRDSRRDHSKPDSRRDHSKHDSKRDDAARRDSHAASELKTKRRHEQDGAPAKRPKSKALDGIRMVRYRIEVGHEKGASAREILGAIANEAGIDGEYVGRIDIQDDHSTVELPEGMPKDTFYHLKKVRVCETALNISELDGGKTAKRSGGKKPKSSSQTTQPSEKASTKPSAKPSKKPRAKLHVGSKHKSKSKSNKVRSKPKPHARSKPNAQA